MTATERALAYVRGTHDQGLSCSDPGADNCNVLTGWVDSDFFLTPTPVAASLDKSCPSMVPLSASAVAAKEASHSPPVQLNTSLSAPSPKRTPTSALFYQGLTALLLAPRLLQGIVRIIARILTNSRIHHMFLRILAIMRTIPCSRPRCVWEDNAACILMSENPVNRDRSRHVDIKFYFLCERVRAGEIKSYKYWGPLDVADALTKSLPWPAFHKHAPFMHGTRRPYRPCAVSGA